MWVVKMCQECIAQCHHFITTTRTHFSFITKTFKVYMTSLFLFARLNLPNVLISMAKKISIAIFLPRVLMYQKHQISLPVGYNQKTGDWEWLSRHFRTPSLPNQISPTFSYFLINNALLYHFLVNWLAHNKKMRNLFFAKLAVLKWRHNRSQSPVLVSRFYTPPEVKFDAFCTSKHGEGKSLSKNFFAILISTLGRFNRASKNSLSYTL